MIDVVASCNFGYSVNAMNDPDNQYHVFAKDSMRTLHGFPFVRVHDGKESPQFDQVT